MEEVAIDASLAIRHGFSYSPYSSLLSTAHMFMLPLEVVDPGGSLSMILSAMFNNKTPVGEGHGRWQGDGGIQLRLDCGDSHPSAGGRWWWQQWSGIGLWQR
jgi:hypothetical protein